MKITKIGLWSVGLNSFFTLSVIISLLFVKVLKLCSFDDHWWDITVSIIFPASITALITGLIAVIKHKERSIYVYISIILGFLVILFIFSHSLFISD